MNIKVPGGMKSPTVVIVSGGTMSGDEKSNKLQEKRMDSLEKKLNQQYKKTTSSSETKEYAKSMEQLHKSFMKKFEVIVSKSKQDISNQNSKLIDALKKVVNQKVQVIKEDAKDNGEYKSFIKKIDSLEDAIRKISLKKTITVNPKMNLDSSFEKLFARMEKAIKESKPRLSPSPS